MENNLLYIPSEMEITRMNMMYSKLADMVLNKALLKFRKEQLRKEIDQTLENRNKEEFLRLTEKLKMIHKTELST